MAMSYLKNPIKVTVGSTDLSANIRIEQRVEVVDPYVKETRLMELIKKYHSSRTNRILIFALYKKEASRLEALIKRNGFKAAAIHGDLSQQQRSAALEGFKNGIIIIIQAQSPSSLQRMSQHVVLISRTSNTSLTSHSLSLLKIIAIVLAELVAQAKLESRIRSSRFKTRRIQDHWLIFWNKRTR